MRAPAGRILAVSAASALAACAGVPTAPAAAGGSAITVALGPCFGFCPVYDVTVSAGGQVSFVGRRHTAVLGERSRQVPTAGYATIAKDLEVFRPASAGETTAECTAAVSDTSPMTVTWTDRSGGKTSLTVASGCPGGPGHALVEVLRGMPARLGVDEWAKQTTRPGASRG